MALIDDIKVTLRLRGSAYDSEVNMLISAALADMRRVGIRESLLDKDNMAALPKQAVAMYVKSRFGYDNDEAARFDEAYRQTVIDLLNSSANSTYKEGTEDEI